MSYEDILATCITALERGESIESCLAMYPEEAERLEPALQLVVRLREMPRPEMSPAAFSKGRELVLEAARKRQAQRAAASTRALTTYTNGHVGGGVNGYHTAFATGQAHTSQTHDTRPAARRFHWPVLSRLATAACLVLVAALVVRAAALSLPGDPLYSVKRAGEELQGVWMVMLGEDAAWRMSRAERRVHELIALEDAGRTPDPALVAEVQAETDAVMDAAAELPPDDREQLLNIWSQKLQVYQQSAGEDSAVAGVLAEPLATVQASLPVQYSNSAVAILPTVTPAAADTLIQTQQTGEPLVAPALIPSATPAERLETDEPLALDVQQPTGRPLARPTRRITLPSATPTIARTPTRPHIDAVVQPTVPTPSRTMETPTDAEESIAQDPSPAARSASAPGATATPTPSRTPRNTPTATRPPATATPRPTATRTPRPTATPIQESGWVALPTVTATPTPQATATRVLPPDSVLLPTPTYTPAPTAQPTAQPTATRQATSEPVYLPTVTNTPLPSPTATTGEETPAEPTNTPTPTATPEATATEPPTPSPTAAATEPPPPTNTATPVETPDPVETPTPEEETPIPTETPTPVVEETPVTETPPPTDTPVPETPTSAPTDTPTPVATDTPVPTDTPTPEAASTATPTDIPAPTDTPAATDTPVPPTDSPTATDTPTLEAAETSEPETPAPTEPVTPEPEPSSASPPTDTPEPEATPLPTDTLAETPTPDTADAEPSDSDPEPGTSKPPATME